MQTRTSSLNSGNNVFTYVRAYSLLFSVLSVVYGAGSSSSIPGGSRDLFHNPALRPTQFPVLCMGWAVSPGNRAAALHGFPSFITSIG
jgi:hypothetical protein